MVPTLADLCAATGVSQRWLNKCFIDVVGVPPLRFLKLVRLSKARQQLLAAETATLVKSLSLSMGYTSSGRFAADYRSVFGENPSDSIRHRLAA
jgi:AraC family ethanolamine operon transcriptional activator